MTSHEQDVVRTLADMPYDATAGSDPVVRGYAMGARDLACYLLERGKSAQLEVLLHDIRGWLATPSE